MHPICKNPEECCMELSRVWEALEVAGEYNGRSASENVANLVKIVKDLQGIGKEPMIASEY